MEGYRKNPMFVARRAERGHFLVPLAEDLKDIKKMHQLNDLGWFVWQRLDKVDDVQQMSLLISQEFEVDRATALGDLQAFLKDLVHAGAIIAEGNAHG